MAKIPYINPYTQNLLVNKGNYLIDSITGESIAEIIDEIPRFVSRQQNYAESFGWQWNYWTDNQSESRGGAVKQTELILNRTHFDKYDLSQKTLLECGMGGGDDTEALLNFSLAEIHSFDLSTSIERANNNIKDERLFISQASIFDIPYPDNAFDIVFCHRVLQHTPDPILAFKSVCRKVKPGGLIFVHAYKRSPEHMREWRYKYRWLTKRLPKSYVFWYVNTLGHVMHKLVHCLYSKGKIFREFAYRFVPFFRLNQGGIYSMKEDEVIEFEKLITFDALTPQYDSPISKEDFVAVLQSEGFDIEFLEDKLISPIFATARKQADS